MSEFRRINTTTTLARKEISELNKVRNFHCVMMMMMMLLIFLSHDTLEVLCPCSKIEPPLRTL